MDRGAADLVTRGEGEESERLVSPIPAFIVLQGEVIQRKGGGMFFENRAAGRSVIPGLSGQLPGTRL